MKCINLFFNSTVLEKNQQIILKATKLVKRKISHYFSLEHDLDIYFYQEAANPNSSVTIPGQTYESGVLFCQILTEKIDIDELVNFLFHEINHARKNELFSTEQHPTLFNWMVLEGLAQAFERQVEIDLGTNWSRFKILKPCSRKELLDGLRQMACPKPRLAPFALAPLDLEQKPYLTRLIV